MTEFVTLPRELVEQVIDALQWYVDDDDVVESMPGNEPWVEGKQRAESAITVLQSALKGTT